jgi:hypothetical protein
MQNWNKELLQNIHTEATKNLEDCKNLSDFLALISDAQMCSFSSDEEIRLIEVYNCLNSLKYAFDAKFAKEEATKIPVVQKKLDYLNENSVQLEKSQSKKNLIEEESRNSASQLEALTI